LLVLKKGRIPGIPELFIYKYNKLFKKVQKKAEN